MFIWPHGIDVDSDGNVWVTDAVSENNLPEGDNRGHHVVKFSPTGEVMMTLGTPGEEGMARIILLLSDVAISSNGDVFVADGHNAVGNNRVVKYDSSGEFLMSWGETGYAPGQFRALHAIAIDLKDESSLGIVAIAGYKSLIKRGSSLQPGPNSDGQAE